LAAALRPARGRESSREVEVEAAGVIATVIIGRNVAFGAPVC
jgi:hypothetical protein